MVLAVRERFRQGDYRRAVLELKDCQAGSCLACQKQLMAYFCIERLDKAIDICRAILEDFPSNAHANCNMALFLYEKGDIGSRHMERVLR